MYVTACGEQASAARGVGAIFIPAVPKTALPVRPVTRTPPVAALPVRAEGRCSRALRDAGDGARG